MNRIARWIEPIVFSSCWLVAPFLFGLIAAHGTAVGERALNPTAVSQTPAPESQGHPSPSATSPR
jgi:hypothetical protein